jgi:hypothetical protein
MDLEELKIKLKNYSKKNIILSEHAKIRALQRNIQISEIIEHITNPNKLYHFEEQLVENSTESKFNCFFQHSNKYIYRFVIILNGKCIIITVIRINKIMQKMVNNI